MDVCVTSVCHLKAWHAGCVCIIRNNNDVICRYTTVIIADTKHFDSSHPAVFCNNIVIYSVNKHNIYW